MHVSPIRFSGVYPEPVSRNLRKTSSTGHEEFQSNGKLYYTTEKDTVDFKNERKRHETVKIESKNKPFGYLDEADSEKKLQEFIQSMVEKVSIPSLANLVANMIHSDSEIPDESREIYDRAMRNPG